MNRAFISLYLIIVSSVIVIGWATERVWRAYNDSHSSASLAIGEHADLPADRKDLISSIFFSFNNRPIDVIQKKIAELSEQLELDLGVHLLDDFTEGEFKDALRKQETIKINRNETELVYYTLAADKAWVLSLTEQKKQRDDVWVQRIFLISFYLLIAIAIYFWVLPLTRDLKRLQDRAERVGRDGLVEKLDLKPSSSVYSLAKSFNRMTARIRELLASQKEMTHAISHELRTPLARMKFTLASIETKSGDSSAWRDIDTNIKELEALISQFLNYASYEAKQAQIEYKEGELVPMLERIVRHGHYSVTVDVDNNLRSEIVRCDWDMIEHCIKNLLENASRYAKNAILVELTETDDSYFIKVHDDGQGVPEEDRERIFDAFYRSSNNSKQNVEKQYVREKRQAEVEGKVARPDKGFGLGLALVKRIIRWHHGSIEVQHSCMGGACFVLSWNKRAK